MKKYINRFYIIIAITAIINFFGITRDNVYQAALDYQRKVAFAFGNGANPDYGTKTAERYSTPAAGASRQKLLAQANAMRVGLQAKTSTVTGIRAAEKKRKNTFEERYGLRKGALTYDKYREIMQALSKVEHEKIDSDTFLRIAFSDIAGKKKNFKSADDILDYIKETEQRPSGAMPAGMAYQQVGAGVVWDAGRKEWVRK